jgi:hypothetical protein
LRARMSPYRVNPATKDLQRAFCKRLFIPTLRVSSRRSNGASALKNHRYELAGLANDRALLPFGAGRLHIVDRLQTDGVLICT